MCELEKARKFQRTSKNLFKDADFPQKILHANHNKNEFTLTRFHSPLANRVHMSEEHITCCLRLSLCLPSSFLEKLLHFSPRLLLDVDE